MLPRRGKHGKDIFFPADVAVLEQSTASALQNFTGCRHSMFPVPIGDDNTGPLTGKAQSHGASYTVGSPGDDGSFFLQSHEYLTFYELVEACG